MTPDMPPTVNRQHDGCALQVVLCTQYLLFRGQTCAERAIVLRLLRRLKAQSGREGEAERRKLRGHWN